MGIKNKIKGVVKLLKKKEIIPIITPVDKEQILSGKVALISGGSGGIGMAIAEAFLKSGAKVILAGTSKEKLRKSVQKLREVTAKSDIAFVEINLEDVKTFPEKVKMASEEFNGIDILVNCAGRNVYAEDFLHVTEENYDSIMDVNIKGTFFLCQEVGQYMIKEGIKGHILNITSASALRPAWSPYMLSKWALRAFTTGLADQFLPYGIIVNAIAPGPVATEMLHKKENDTVYMDDQPSERYAVPAEIANMALFMVSDMGNLIVGDSVYMTGGSGILSLHH